MAIPDLLWACPVCGEDRGLEAEGRVHRCRACATTFRRGQGATIEATSRDGAKTLRPAAEWLDLLPAPKSFLSQHVSNGDLIRHAKVEARWVVGDRVVRGEDGYLNRIEVWGTPSPGRLELRPDRLIFVPREGQPTTWPLESLTAVQASSSALQLNGAGVPLVELSFEDDSIYLWERLLCAALDEFYRRTGRGAIVEYQPRIVTE